MAAANYHLEEDDDDEFYDYNPHPYSGGFDISAAYGSPLPPSHATCYPVSTPAPPPLPSSLPQPPHNAPAPQPPPPLPSSLPQPPHNAPAAPPVAEPYYWPKPHDYGEGYQHQQPLYASPEVFRGWPYLSSGARCHSSAPCGRDYWRQCMRGLDYLFGHCDGYGERQIGVDCHGVPVYANRKGAAEGSVVVVEVAPPATGTVQWHDSGEEQYQSNRQHLSSWYSNAEEETYAYAQPAYTSYDRPYDEQSYSPHGGPDEPTWFPSQSYQEVYKAEDSQYQEFSSYDADNKVSSQPIFCYNQHFGEQPLHIHVQPPETVSSHKLEYYENFSTYANQYDVDNLESSRHSYEIQPYEHIPYDQPESYRPSWSPNSGYYDYEACTEGVSPEYDNQTLASGECWDMSSLFLSPFYPQETQIYEPSHGDEIV